MYSERPWWGDRKPNMEAEHGVRDMKILYDWLRRRSVRLRWAAQ